MSFRRIIAGSFAVAVLGAGCGQLESRPYPTRGELAERTGKLVVPFPDDGSDLEKVGTYCMEVGSDEQDGVWGRNLHESVCNTGKSADLDEHSYSPGEQGDICDEAGGEQDIVRKDKTTGTRIEDLVWVCVTDIPLAGTVNSEELGQD